MCHDTAITVSSGRPHVQKRTTRWPGFGFPVDNRFRLFRVAAIFREWKTGYGELRNIVRPSRRVLINPIKPIGGLVAPSWFTDICTLIVGNTSHAKSASKYSRSDVEIVIAQHPYQRYGGYNHRTQCCRIEPRSSKYQNFRRKVAESD